MMLTDVLIHGRHMSNLFTPGCVSAQLLVHIYLTTIIISMWR